MVVDGVCAPEPEPEAVVGDPLALAAARDATAWRRADAS